MNYLPLAFVALTGVVMAQAPPAAPPAPDAKAVIVAPSAGGDKAGVQPAPAETRSMGAGAVVTPPAVRTLMPSSSGLAPPGLWSDRPEYRNGGPN